MKKRLHIIWLVCICLLGAAIAFNIEHIAIRYHLWMMMKAHERMESSTDKTALSFSPLFKSYERHRDALVGLRYFEKREFRLKYVMSGSPEFKAVWKSMIERFPNLGDMNSPYEPGTPCIIRVWATSNEMAMVTQFVAEVDREK